MASWFRRPGLQSPAADEEAERSRAPHSMELVVAQRSDECTPLFHDGVLFVHAYGDKVQALDAVTGDLLWQYSRRLPMGACRA